MNLKLAAFLAVSVILAVVGITALDSSNWLVGIPCIWAGVVGFVLTFNFCAGTRNKQLDQEIAEYAHYQRSQTPQESGTRQQNAA